MTPISFTQSNTNYVSHTPLSTNENQSISVEPSIKKSADELLAEIEQLKVEVENLKKRKEIESFVQTSKKTKFWDPQLNSLAKTHEKLAQKDDPCSIIYLEFLQEGSSLIYPVRLETLKKCSSTYQKAFLSGKTWQELNGTTIKIQKNIGEKPFFHQKAVEQVLFFMYFTGGEITPEEYLEHDIFSSKKSLREIREILIDVIWIGSIYEMKGLIAKIQKYLVNTFGSELEECFSLVFEFPSEFGFSEFLAKEICFVDNVDDELDDRPLKYASFLNDFFTSASPELKESENFLSFKKTFEEQLLCYEGYMTRFKDRDPLPLVYFLINYYLDYGVFTPLENLLQIFSRSAADSLLTKKSQLIFIHWIFSKTKSPGLQLPEFHYKALKEYLREEKFDRLVKLKEIKEYKVSKEDLERTILLYPHCTITKLALAKILIEMKEFDRALEILNEALKIDPLNKTLYALRGECFFSKRDLEKADNEFTVALSCFGIQSINDFRSPPKFELVGAPKTLGLTLSSEILTQKDAQSLYHRAYCRKEKGDFLQAYQDICAFCQFPPIPQEVLYYKGYFLYALGKEEEAITFLSLHTESASQRSLSNALVSLNLQTFCYTLLEDHKNAELCRKKVFEITSDESYSFLSLAYEALNKKDTDFLNEAFIYLEKATKGGPSSQFSFLVNLQAVGSYYNLMKGFSQKAFEDAESCLKYKKLMLSNRMIALGVKAMCYLQQEKFQQALDDFDFMLDPPKHLFLDTVKYYLFKKEEILFSRGICHLNLGNKEKALKDFTAAVQCNSSYLEAKKKVKELQDQGIILLTS